MGADEIVDFSTYDPVEEIMKLTQERDITQSRPIRR
jgi:hypothetical protein